MVHNNLQSVSIFAAKNWFILGIFIVIILGIVIPEVGVFLNPEGITNTGIIILLFLITGLTLPTNALKSDLKNVKLHIYIQFCIFILTPLLFFLLGNIFSQNFSQPVLIGIYALAVLPTTISSCIVFTASVDGNIVGTMFNAAVANIMGIFISPLLLSLLLKDAYRAIPTEELVSIFKSLLLKMLLPILAGQGIRFFLSRNIQKHKKSIKIISNILILLIIFFALSKTAGSKNFRDNLSGFALPVIVLAFSNILLVLIIFSGTKIIKFSKKDSASAVFAGSQKTMAMGVPLLSAFFAFQPDLLGVVLLPLLFYHPWQLLVAAFVKKILFEKRAE